MRLATEAVRPEAAEPRSWIHFLHGIFGAGRNWRSMARRTVDALDGWGGLLVDLRLHGGSRAASPPHTLEACADDLLATVEDGAPPPRVLVGHSFGGKVALETAARGPEGLEQAWILDAAPSASEPGGDAVEMLDVLRRRPGPFEDRSEAAAALGEEGFPPRVGRWMATNLEPSDGGLAWALDVDALEELLRDFFRRDLWPVLERPPAGTRLHVVKAEGSPVMDEEDARRVSEAVERTGRVELHRLEGDHWLNVSNPGGLLELLQRRMPR